MKNRPYKINPCERKFHDPWGNRRGNRNGITMFQYQVAKAEIETYFGPGSVNQQLWCADKSRLMEHNFGRFVRTNSRVEKLRR